MSTPRPDAATEISNQMGAFAAAITIATAILAARVVLGGWKGRADPPHSGQTQRVGGSTSS
jgi:hypothetical protein